MRGARNVRRRAHLGTATDTDRGWLVAQTGSLLFRRMVFGRWADCQSATQQTASLRSGGSATMRPTRGEQVVAVQLFQNHEMHPFPKSERIGLYMYHQ